MSFDLSKFSAIEPVAKTEKMSVTFGKTGRISFSGGLIDKIASGMGSLVQDARGLEIAKHELNSSLDTYVDILIDVEVGEIERTRNVKLKSDATKTKKEKYKSNVTKSKRVAFVFNRGGKGCKLNKQTKGNQYYISALNYCKGHDALKTFLKKATTFQHGAISFENTKDDGYSLQFSENNIAIVNLMASGKNKVVKKVVKKEDT